MMFEDFAALGYDEELETVFLWSKLPLTTEKDLKGAFPIKWM